MHGKCPKCDALVPELRMDEVQAGVGLFPQKKWKAVTYCCPSCSAVLGAGLHPLALMEETVKGVLRGINKR